MTLYHCLPRAVFVVSSVHLGKYEEEEEDDEVEAEPVAPHTESVQLG